MATTGKDELDEVIVSWRWYGSCWWKQALFVASAVLTLGVTWLLAVSFPCLAAICRYTACSPKESAVVLAKEGGATSPLLVEVHGTWWCYCEDSNNFAAIPRMPADLPQQLERALKALKDIEKGGDWADFNPPSIWSRKRRLAEYGPNKIQLAFPGIVSLTLIELSNPLLVIPIMQTVVWVYSLDCYLYPFLLLGVLLIGVATSVTVLYRQRLRLAAVVAKTCLVPYVSKGYIHAMKGTQLVPGDVVVLQPGLALCDLVVLRGSCLIEDASLTGESSQSRKVPFNPDRFPGVVYDTNIHRLSTVFCGSLVQQVWNEVDAQDECLAMVVFTGNNTAVGKMFQHLNSTDRGPSSKSLPFGMQRKDLRHFLLMSFVLNLAIFFVQVPWMVRYQLSGKPLLIQFVFLFLNIMVPFLPAALVVLKSVTLLRMRYQGLQVSRSESLYTAAQLDLVVFDKTGTLTAEQGRLHGVVTCEHHKMQGLKSEAIGWNSEVRKNIALCNDLVPVARNQLAGNLAEKKAFLDVEASFVKPEVISLPMRPKLNEPAKQVQMKVLTRFEFDRDFLMSAVIAQQQNSTSEPELYLKGSPAAVALLIGASNLPRDWSQTPVFWTNKGFRVLALASAKVIPESCRDLSKLSLVSIKQHIYSPKLLGYAVTTAPLRSDTRSAITELQQRGRIKTMMATGDHPLTAMSVALSCGIISPDSKRLLVELPHNVRQAPAHDGDICAWPRALKDAAMPTSPGQAARLKLSPLVHPPPAPLGDPGTSAGLQGRLASLPLLRSPAAHTGLQLPFQADQHRAAESSQSHAASQQSMHGEPALTVGALVPSSSQPLNSVSQEAPKHSRIWSWRSRQIAHSPTDPAAHTFRIHMTQLSHAQTTPPGFAAAVAAQQSSTGQYEVVNVELVHAQSAEADFNRSEFEQTSPSTSHSPALSALKYILAENKMLCPVKSEEAISKIAEGAQCIMTGPVFEHLLQHAEPAELELILRGTAVCARMRSHQKSQLVQLLGPAGLKFTQHRHFQGLGHVVGYCGDGVNDLPALHAADLGIGLGPGEAVIGSPVVSLRMSISVVATMIREARCSLMIAYTIFKFMSLYGINQGIVAAIAFVVARSGLAAVQYDIIDIVCIAVTAGFIATRPSNQLHAIRPPSALMSRAVLAPLTFFMLYCVAMHVIAHMLLHREDWYPGHSDRTSDVATVLLVGFCQVLNPAISFARDMQPHSLGLRQNWFTPAVVAIASVLLYVEALYPSAYNNADILYQQGLPFSFRLKLVIQNHIGIFVLVVVLLLMKRYVRRHMQATQQAATQVSPEPAVSLEAASRHNSIWDGSTLQRPSATLCGASSMRHSTSAMSEIAALLPQKQ